jgi:hypothetical protein
MQICSMSIESFISSLSHPGPPSGSSPLLQALWHDGNNNWQKAHEIAQDIETSDGSWIHAYLHRKEGDSSNAAYWYRRAGKPVPNVSLDTEWKQIVAAVLAH